MTKSKPYSDMERTFSPELKRRIDAWSRMENAEMPYHQIRWARHMAQKHFAKIMNVEEMSVAELERQADAYISCLRSQVERYGGTLKIVAEWAGAEVPITTIGDIGDPFDPHVETDEDDDIHTLGDDCDPSDDNLMDEMMRNRDS